MKLPKWVTALGVGLSLAAVLVDPSNMPALSAVLGANAATKAAALGTILAAVGRAIFGATKPTP